MTGRGVAAEHVGQRAAGLAQREVERRALEAPSGGSCGRPACSGAPPGNRSSSPRCSRERRRTSTRRRAAAPGRAACWASLVVGVVGDVLAEALLAAAVQADRSWSRARSRGDGRARGLRARSPRSSGAGRRRVRRASSGEPDGTPSSGPRCSRRSRFFVLIEVVGLAAAPLAALVLGRLPGAGLGLRQGARAAAGRRGWCGWPASLRVAPYGVRLIVGVLVLLGVAGAAASALRLRVAAAARWRASAGAPRGCAARAAAEDPVRRRLFWGAEAVFAVVVRARWRCSSRSRPTSGTPRSRWTWRSSTPINASTHFPPHDPWMSGRDAQLLLPRPPRCWRWPIEAARRRARRRLQPRRRGAVRAHRDGGVHARRDAVGGRARARRARRAAGRSAPGWRRSALCLVLGNLAGARELAQRRRARRATTTGSAPSRVIPDTINEFPSFSFMLGDLHAHVLALPFTLLALAFALQVALAGPRGDVALARASPRRWPPALAIGALYAINSWSYPGRRRAAGRRRASPGCADPRARRARRVRRSSGPVLVLVGQRRARAAVLPGLRPGGARASALVHDAPRRSRAGSATWR